MILDVRPQRSLALALLALFALIVRGVGATGATAAPGAPLQSSFTIFLPVVAQRTADKPVPSPSPSPTPPPSGSGGDNAGAFWLPFTTADNSYVGTGRTNIAVDGAGGIHLTYVDVLGLDDGQRPAYYAYCPAACGNPAHWSRTTLGSDVFDVRLQLDGQGRPRAMIYAYLDHSGDDFGTLKQYQYAACDAGCTDATSWTITPLTDAITYDANRPDQPFHYFALDTEGHPGFVYSDTTNHDNHGGAFYAFCHADPATACTDLANWRETTLTDSLLWQPELAYAPDGQPRILATYINYDQHASGLLYYECADDCAALKVAELWNAAGYTSYRLRLTHAGQPRVVLYTGMARGVLESSQLYYASCDSDCANGKSWQALNLHSQNGTPMTVDLALDRQDRPRFAYKQGDVGPGYAWCDDGCESEGATWHATLAESNAQLQQENPIEVIQCSEASWTSGHLPQLALDPQGEPRFSFDTRFQYGGTNLAINHPGESCPVSTLIPLARFLIPNQP